MFFIAFYTSRSIFPRDRACARAHTGPRPRHVRINCADVREHLKTYIAPEAERNFKSAAVAAVFVRVRVRACALCPHTSAGALECVCNIHAANM